MSRRKPPPAKNSVAPTEPEGQPGLILAHHGQSSLVESASGDVVRCSTRRSLPRTVSGDRVLWQPSSPREGVITAVLERDTVLSRPDHNHRVRPVAANIDQIVVVIASKPSFEYQMLDSYLVAAELIGTQPVIVVNKSDLLDHDSRSKLEERLAVYQSIGYTLLFTSTHSTDGLRDLHQQLKTHTSVLVGQSGVGKSSLIQALLPELNIRTGSLSQVTGLGRHTTTVAMLYHLPDGGDLIDSPGVRDFNLVKTPIEDLQYGFREFRPYLGQCRFHNCRHISEPSCAVQAAAREGGIVARRLENYCNLVGAMAGTGNKACT
ncbi:Ribosome small subunit biogenesis RbfA-release protein RsgA [hydrothermal vent metagenome]|uniref:Ribosome small subunit biogenesis RbfA-release protein RsgA n=1 Tax=hydrothermal vent metagenome TaxID=652676 RepID=A0A3B0YYC9_9ZZZZ